MALREIVCLPSPVLRQVALPLESDAFNADLQILLDDMFETMYDAPGVGLAAPQIGISRRISVIDVTPNKSEQYVLINPEIIHAEDIQTMQEGCLSVPGVYEKVKRANQVTMRALDRHGKSYELSAEGLLAEAIQHEIDHLNGKLFIDLLSPLKRRLARRKQDKFLRNQRSG